MPREVNLPGRECPGSFLRGIGMLKAIACAAMMGWVCFVAWDVRSEDGNRMVCPNPWSVEQGDYSRCHRVPEDRKVQFGRNVGSMTDTMAEVCDAEGKDCYTGYVKAGQF